jgi:hypothetical protein
MTNDFVTACRDWTSGAPRCFSPSRRRSASRTFRSMRRCSIVARHAAPCFTHSRREIYCIRVTAVSARNHARLEQQQQHQACCSVALHFFRFLLNRHSSICCSLFKLHFITDSLLNNGRMIEGVVLTRAVARGRVMIRAGLEQRALPVQSNARCAGEQAHAWRQRCGGGMRGDLMRCKRRVDGRQLVDRGAAERPTPTSAKV